MGYKLSILICSLESRRALCNNLKLQLKEQKNEAVEVIIYEDKGELSIGEKRNKLLKRAKGEYVCFIDDDDEISKNYINLALEGIKLGVDCCSLRGVITWDGSNSEIFEHSIKYDEYKTNDTGAIRYERYPNHLNVI